MSDFCVTILGSASAIPTQNRNPSAQWVDIYNHVVLIDCAEATQHQIRKFRKSLQKINTILISHLHGDHYLGLPGIISTLNLLGREKTLEIYGPPGINELLQLHLRISNIVLKYTLEIVELTPGQSQIIKETEHWKIKSFPLKHRITTFGYIIEENPRPRKINKQACESKGISHAYMNLLKQGKDIILPDGTIIANDELTFDPPPPRKYAYCSDTIYLEDIIPHIQNSDLLYHEATFDNQLRDRAIATMHSTGEDAAKIAAKANVKHLIIGHFSNRYNDSSIILKEAREIFPNTTAVEDGDCFKL